MGKPLTRVELDIQFGGGCSEPGCKCQDDDLFLAQGCHPGLESPMKVTYNCKKGVLHVMCAVCERTVAYIQVASGL